MATMVKIACLDDAFLEAFLTPSKPSRSITTAERNEKEKKERQKKILKSILISPHARAKMS